MMFLRSKQYNHDRFAPRGFVRVSCDMSFLCWSTSEKCIEREKETKGSAVERGRVVRSTGG